MRDPFIRRFITASVLATAFVWVAVRYFDVETDVVWRFLIGSVLLVLGMIALASVFSLLLVWWRRRRNRLLDDRRDESNRDLDDR